MLHDYRTIGSKLCSTLLAIAAIAGCRGTELETAKVVGKVTLDGKPVPRGTVMFTPKFGRAAHGIVGSDGSFSMSTYADEDGAVVGLNQVAVFVVLGEGATPEEVASVVPIPPRYASPETSGLTCEVKPGQTNEVLLELKTE